MGAKLGGGGGGKYKIEQNSEINVTPFVDVMLVLLIIFMVSIPVATVSIKLDLPPPVDNPNNTVKKEPVFVSIMGPNDIYVKGKKTTLETLDADVRAALQSDDPLNERVMVQGYKEIEYKDFVKVLNELQQHGYLKIGLISEDIE
jgi:biopolymer transport protein ExbD